MPAYLIVNYAVENPELYGKYSAAAGPALNIGTDCKLRVFDPKSDVLEGEGVGHQTVMLEYESKQAAREAYESKAYQDVIGMRHDATSHHFAVIVDGLPG
jgi:uncharacterized protein (DUF1330 family)